jgi:predicted 3-demethylubiquinone-9 3-methyltransferase (glyoxalase superfamily)
MQKITPFLWFDNQAEEAINFYTGIFKTSKVVNTSPGPDGKIMMGTFQIEGQEFHVLNGGPQHFHFNESISFFVDCKTQAEVDYFWEKLSAGGEESQCGWLKDKYGLSWQIVPSRLGELLGDPDAEKAQRAMQAMLKMKKIDIKGLERAYAGQ